jgi:FeS assembly SUF system regulator
MLKLSKLTDYGVVVLSSLATDRHGQMSATELSQVTGLPEPTVAKVLKQSSHAGIVTGQRGAAGGYRLAKPARDISVANMIEAFEGPIALTACVDGASGGCSVEQLCPMRHNWDVVNRAIYDALSKVTLHDMANGRVPASMFGLEPLKTKELKQAELAAAAE